MKSAFCGAPQVVMTSSENTGPFSRSPEPKQMPFSLSEKYANRENVS